MGKTSIFEVGKMAHSIADNITSTFEMLKFPLGSGLRSAKSKLSLYDDHYFLNYRMPL